MFNPPQDRSLFLNSVHPAAVSSNLPASAHTGGPQQQVHAGERGSVVYLTPQEFFERLKARYPKLRSSLAEGDWISDRPQTLADVARVYDAAIRLASADLSAPFISDTPWRESDHDYRNRLADMHPHNDHSTLDSYGLDAVGKGYGVLRARLVATWESFCG